MTRERNHEQAFLAPGTEEEDRHCGRREGLGGDERLSAAEAEKKELLDKMSRPSGLSDDEVLEKASIFINRAVERSQLPVQVYRFPHTLCTDNGRAINQAEEGWEKTLTGVPRRSMNSGSASSDRAAITSLRDHQLSGRHAGRR